MIIVYTNSGPPKVIIEGRNQANVGTNVTIQCNILEGYPLPSVYIITPRGQIDQSTATFNVTIEDTGNYSCIANNSLATVTSNLSLIVYGMYGIILHYVALLILYIHHYFKVCVAKSQ